MITGAELQIVALIVFQEARGEAFNGQVAVAEVIRNRVRSTCHKNNVKDVVFSPRQFSGVGAKGVPQTPAAAKAVDGAAWGIAVTAADLAFNGLTQVAGGATHFVRFDYNPKWKGNGTGQRLIGNHLFMQMKSGC